eukprot:SAG31_NODE_1406_length_8487_cov_4.584883_2_plen_74_part_00
MVPASCVNGTSIMIGRCPEGVGISLVGDTLVSTACAQSSFCVLAPATETDAMPLLGPCSSPLARGWNASNTIG